eukprot:16440714-Heterocapsa_arctica.AAC.1
MAPRRRLDQGFLANLYDMPVPVIPGSDRPAGRLPGGPKRAKVVAIGQPGAAHRVPAGAGGWPLRAPRGRGCEPPWARAAGVDRCGEPRANWHEAALVLGRPWNCRCQVDRCGEP